MTATIPADEATAVAEATLHLDARGLVAYPAGGRYALGADALDEDAVARALSALRRPPDAGLSVVVPDLESARHVARLTPAARRLEPFLPGPLTILLPAAGTAPENLFGGAETVAVRVPAEPFARALAAHFGPVTAPRAAPGPTAPPPRRAVDALSGLGDRVALVVDDGDLADAPPSTVVDATGASLRVVKEGAFPLDALPDPA